MKKVLFASTALVAFTGASVAEVSLSGRAEMGIFGGDGIETQLFSDVDVSFTMSGETDGGLTFGASIDLDESDDQGLVFDPDDPDLAIDLSSNPSFGDDSEAGGAEIFISGNFGTVTLGDTDGALDWALTEAGNVGNPGSIADDETSHAGYFGSFHDGVYDGQILRYDYSAGNFGVAVSVEMDDEGGRDDGFAIGFKYSTDFGGTNVDLGIGFQSVDLTAGAGGDADIIGVSANATLAAGFSAGIQYTDGDILGIDGSSHIGIGIGYETGPISVHLNYGDFDLGGADASGFGIAAAYDLGGGALVHFGYGDSDIAGVDADTFSLGLGLSF